MKFLKSISTVMLFAVLTVCTLSAGDHQIKNLKLDKKDGIYKCGETITVSGLVCDRKKPLSAGTLVCNIKWEGKVVERKKFPCNGKPFEFTYTNNKPGWVYFEFRLLNKKGREVKNPAIRVRQRRKARYLLAEIGAMYDPHLIRSTVPAPADLDQFWERKISELAKVPMDVLRMDELDPGVPGIKLFAIAVKCLGDLPVTAYLAYPEKAAPKSLPGFVNYLSWSWNDANRKLAVQQAKNGMLALCATWHGQPVGKEKAFYTEQGRIFNGSNTASTNIDDPDKWFFSGMYMRVLRALDYLKSRPEWNGKDLIVQGGSLGGAETVCAAAFDKAVTLAVVGVPGFCEFNAAVDGRKLGSIFRRMKNVTPAHYKGASYFDLVNLTPKIKCEIYFATGFADELCPPSNVFAAYNNLPDGIKKDIYTNPYTGHYGSTKNVTATERLKKFIGEVKVHNYPGLGK